MTLSSSCFQGRPKGVTPKYSLKPLVPRLSELLGVEVCPPSLSSLKTVILNFVHFSYLIICAHCFYRLYCRLKWQTTALVQKLKKW